MSDNRLLITGASIWTDGQPWESPLGELLIQHGVVEAVERPGTLNPKMFSGLRRLNLPGGVILPAFFDAHLHLDLGGEYLSRIALRECSSAKAVLDRLAAEQTSGSGWMIAIGLPEYAWPSHEDLQRVTGGRPAILFSRDYHSAWINREGRAEVGLTTSTAHPVGGSFEKDARGNPTGLLRENAVRWAEDKLPPLSDEQRRKILLRATTHLTEMGILGVSDASDRSAWDSLRALSDDGALPLRVEHWHRCLELDESCLEIERVDQPRLKRQRIKTFSDGALGSHTAWMLEEYSDVSGNRGAPVPELEPYRAFLTKAAGLGWSHAVHAIGDAAVRWVAETLDAIPANGLPHRIEHVQHVDAIGLERLKRGVHIASIQPTHRLDDTAMLVARLGRERADLSYPQRSLLRDGGKVVLGTDWPVVSADPRRTIQAAISPRNPGEGMPGEELTIEQALAALTCHPAAIAGFRDVGKLEPGFAADFLWLPEDPVRDPEAWRDVEIGGVWSGGEMLHGKSGLL